jgi:trans-aconitate 2-methyltransferase
LLAGLPALKGLRAVDIGCGTGSLTAQMHHLLGLKETLGFDSSPAMLEDAKQHAAPGLRFERQTIEAFDPKTPYDLVLSNAALQWVDDHEALLARLKNAVAPGGWLAVQVPANHGHPSHVLAAEVAGEVPFAEALHGYRRQSPVLGPDRYAEILARLGFEEPKVWTRAYLHRLESRDAVVEWVKGTLLTDYQKRMPPALWPKFLQRYTERLLPALKDEKPYLYPFLRTFLWAQKS